jgi:hypothetical protein
MTTDAAMSEITAGRENRRQRPKGYAPWSPHARTRALLEQVDKVLEEYESYLPLSGDETIALESSGISGRIGVPGRGLLLGSTGGAGRR